ncbi:hypothetical protein NBM05_09410 [Rothia sp. AR01]|uniref:Uncharacterized protein n=1 Tax=Rothia santali TaxID=2949643 RepID=A0A9X2KIG4_9MICC|nr:hypothetical protein [Rothia santali]MCP3426218.1 hypothetical protein [Rothia santali]
MIKTLQSYGLKSDHLYAAGFVSIGLSYTSWAISRIKKGDSKSQSDRWGIFIGHWAPSFFALGNALQLAELKK